MLIAITVMGINVMADHASCNNNLYLSDTVNVTVHQWIESCSYNIGEHTYRIFDYGDKLLASIADFQVFSNGRYKIFTYLDTSAVSGMNVTDMYLINENWQGNNQPPVTFPGAQATLENATATTVSGGTVGPTTESGWAFKGASNNVDQNDLSNGAFSPNRTQHFYLYAEVHIPASMNVGNYGLPLEIWLISYANFGKLSF